MVAVLQYTTVIEIGVQRPQRSLFAQPIAHSPLLKIVCPPMSVQNKRDNTPTQVSCQFFILYQKPGFFGHLDTRHITMVHLAKFCSKNWMHYFGPKFGPLNIVLSKNFIK